ncbi:Dephospho-CoA kinase [hydrothermal vent metagenome]|uniref:Dephospho-CoA kinase n=1 Tax=hydrothermal vent metagenome TaxID=652676 RepID=A0A3B0VRN0_9ZZZZ
MPKFKVCLTGGIASGKTYVSDKLSELGAHVIDADILARQVVRQGSEGLVQVVSSFGLGVLNADKTLNRSMLKELVFNDKEKLEKLNSILHPLIRKVFVEASDQNQMALEVWVIPLFNGESEYMEFNRVLLVDVKEDIQLDRIKERDQVNIEIAQAIINSQPSRQSRLALASDVIENNKDFKSLDVSIKLIFDLYNKMIISQSA